MTVDTRPADGHVARRRGDLSPDGNGQADTLSLTWTSNEPIAGVVRIRDGAGTSVRAWTFTRRSRDRDLERPEHRRHGLPTAATRFRVDGLDRAGNQTVVDRAILVDRTIRSVPWAIVVRSTRRASAAGC